MRFSPSLPHSSEFHHATETLGPDAQLAAYSSPGELRDGQSEGPVLAEVKRQQGRSH